MVPPQTPLAGVTVLDLTRVLSGPYCTMLLGDLGARVIKIERPGLGDDTRAWGPPFVDGESTYFLCINRNKESVTLDFGHQHGRAVLERLASRADVLVENFRPGTLDAIQFDYASVSARYPRLVYASISGYGQTGPRRDEPGYDAVMQAEGGLMSITGPADGPAYRLGVAVADFITGVFTAQGVLAALIAREKTGHGQHVDVGMLDTVTSMLTYQAGIWFATGQPPHRMGNRHPSIAPYDTYTASDGEFVLAVGNDAQFRACCGIVGQPALADDPRFATNAARVAHVHALGAILADVFARRTRAEWIGALASAGVPAGSVRDVGEVLLDPQAAARDMVVKVEHATLGTLEQLGLPVKLSGTPGSVRLAPPVLGQHTDVVLRDDLGFSDAEIGKLRQEGVV